MSKVEQRFTELGLVLPAPLHLPLSVVLRFPWARIVGMRALISGHGPTNADGSLAQPLGKVGSDVSLEQAYASARLTALAVLGSLKRELDLDRIAAWSRVFGMVNSAPGFNKPTCSHQWLHRSNYRGLWRSKGCTRAKRSRNGRATVQQSL